MRLRTAVLAIALAAGILVGSAPAQPPATPQGTQPDFSKGLTDAQFVTLAAASDLAEINLGRVGTERAASADVKKFAEKMVADHTKSSKELLAMAAKKGLAPSVAKMDAKHEALMAKLLQTKGPEFDQMYMMHMVADHQMAAALFEAQAKTGKDEELRAFAMKTLPVVQEHLKMAQEISGKLKGGGGDGK